MSEAALVRKIIEAVRRKYPRAYLTGTKRQRAALANCISRFQRHVRQGAGCWEWTGCHSPRGGYGIFTINGCAIKAHWFSFVLAGGKMKKDEILHHKCRNKGCVNPHHLQATTPRNHAMNLTPGFRAHDRSHAEKCARGHPFSPANTYRTSRGHRRCRECKREGDRAFRQKHGDRLRRQDRERYPRRRQYMIEKARQQREARCGTGA